MQLKNILQLFFKLKPKYYGYTVRNLSLCEKSIEYAVWNHPKVKEPDICNEDVLFYKNYVTKGDFCIDIGAHMGDTTLPMGIATGKDGFVLALEPNPHVFHVLDKNARANAHCTSIRPIMAAASNKEIFQTFEYSDASFCNGGKHQDISILKHGHVYPLNVFCINLKQELETHYKCWLPKLRFIKIDTEGYDFVIIKTIADIITKYRPVIKSEVYKKTSKAYRQDLLKFFDDIQYDVLKFSGDTYNIEGKLTTNNMYQSKNYDVLCVPK